MSSDIGNFEDLELFFDADKIKNDLCELYGISKHGLVEIVSYNDVGLKKEHTFSRADTVFISTIRVMKRYTGEIFLPYLIEAIVGDFTLHKNTGILTHSKYRADIFYNEDYQIATVDYYHWE